MKVAGLLPLAALGSALVIPDESVWNDVQAEPPVPEPPHLDFEHLKEDVKNAWDDTYDAFEAVEFGLRDAVQQSKNAIDNAVAQWVDTDDHMSDRIRDIGSWLSHHLQGQPPKPLFEEGRPPRKHHPNRPPPPPEDLIEAHDCPFPPPPHKGDHHQFSIFEDDDVPSPPPPPPHHDGPPNPDKHHEKNEKKGGKHGGHKKPHEPSNRTIYELIAESKYTTKLAKLINDEPDLVQLLNGTTANFTVFAPTDKAFDKIPKGHEPSKEFIKKLLTYHVSGEFYPAGRVLKTYTIPTLYNEPELGEEPQPQRLSLNVGFKGLTVNFYSRIIAVDIFGSNGVIHAIDSILLPPPEVTKIISLLPSEFSTLSLGLTKTGLLEALNETAHLGGTFFAPSNWAFKKLGPRINAFLFSDYGEKYLTAILKYHVVLNQTLYSDAFYNTKPVGDIEARRNYHFDLPTLLDDRALSVDVGRHGPFIEIKVNGFSRVAVKDGIAKDGVIQVVSSVLIPPKQGAEDEAEHWMGEEMSVEEFKARLEPYVEHEESTDGEEWQEL
ncbi:FAS1 domain-containing protein [Phyllosticta citrichinensis]|uniref:FAS1 domain-containing protein n=1 Tax=Phyllosticta citrichinensis TaxID=1130410 RepID=A0ABR1XSX9_9PEZI